MSKRKARKPLSGKTVVVTRPRDQGAELTAALRRQGARVIAAPAIRIAPPSSWAAMDRGLRKLGEYHAVIFTSANGVSQFFDRARKILNQKPEKPERLYAIGPATAQALKAAGWNGVRVPKTYEGAALARFLGPVRGWNILIPRARVARDVLPKTLRARGARVDVVEAYRTTANRAGLADLRRCLSAGEADFVTFTSSSTVEQSLKSLGSRRARDCFRKTAAASIGPITSRALRRHGIRPAVEARPYTAEGLVESLIHHVRHASA